MTEPAIPPIKYKKILPSASKHRHLVLFNLTSLRKFNIYNDVEVGVPLSMQNKLQETGGDEDYDSSEEIIQHGVKKCMKILTSGLSQTESSFTESAKDSPKTRPPSPPPSDSSQQFEQPKCPSDLGDKV